MDRKDYSRMDEFRREFAQFAFRHSIAFTVNVSSTTRYTATCPSNRSGEKKCSFHVSARKLNDGIIRISKHTIFNHSENCFQQVKAPATRILVEEYRDLFNNMSILNPKDIMNNSLKDHQVHLAYATARRVVAALNEEKRGIEALTRPQFISVTRGRHTEEANPFAR